VLHGQGGNWNRRRYHLGEIKHSDFFPHSQSTVEDLLWSGRSKEEYSIFPTLKSHWTNKYLLSTFYSWGSVIRTQRWKLLALIKWSKSSLIVIRSLYIDRGNLRNQGQSMAKAGLSEEMVRRSSWHHCLQPPHEDFMLQIQRALDNPLERCGVFTHMVYITLAVRWKM
jgi:hypothetical protein